MSLSNEQLHPTNLPAEGSKVSARTFGQPTEEDLLDGDTSVDVTPVVGTLHILEVRAPWGGYTKCMVTDDRGDVWDVDPTTIVVGTKLAEDPLEVVPRDPLHMHDGDDQPVVCFDLNGTLTSATGYPIDAPPYPGVKGALDRLKSQNVCLHVTTAGLYVGAHDVDIQAARIAMCSAWAAEHGLPIDAWLPKVPAHCYVDDRMVPTFGGDWSQVAPLIEATIATRFDLVDGVWRAKPEDDTTVGTELDGYPEFDEVPGDHPRGLSAPVVDVDLHRTLTLASSSTRDAEPVPGAVEAIRAIYEAGYTVHISCAGWNPAVKGPAVSQQRLAGIRRWLATWSVPFDSLVGKDHFHAVVDDKGVRFTTWEETLPPVMQRLQAPTPEPVVSTQNPTGFVAAQ